MPKEMMRRLRREAPNQALNLSAADVIEALEHDKAILLAKYDQAKTDRDTSMVKHIREYADLERQLSEARQREDDAVSQHDTLRDQRDAEKALADRLWKALQGSFIEYAEDEAEFGLADAAYRKARGL